MKIAVRTKVGANCIIGDRAEVILHDTRLDQYKVKKLDSIDTEYMWWDVDNCTIVETEPTEELDKYKEALDLALRTLQTARESSGTDDWLGKKLAEKIAQINSILNPEPEFIEVEESLGWVNVYPIEDEDNRVAVRHSSEEEANKHAQSHRIACIELKHTVKKPKATSEKKVRIEIDNAQCYVGTDRVITINNNSVEWDKLQLETGKLSFEYER